MTDKYDEYDEPGTGDPQSNGHAPQQRREWPEVMEYDLAPAEQRVRLRDPSTGQVDDYLLVEVNGSERDKHLNFVSSRTRTLNGKPAGISNFDSLSADLVHRCLWKLMPDGSREQVSVKFIQALPNHILEDLHDRAQELCGLDKKAVEQVGNA